MSDRLALLKAILAAPDDDLPRLVFADWLEENGTSDADVARAEFIRLGCLVHSNRTHSKSPQEYSPISQSEQAWLDQNWKRLLPRLLAVDGGPNPQMTAGGDAIQINLLRIQSGKAQTTHFGIRYVRGFATRVTFSNSVAYERHWQAVALDEPLSVHMPRDKIWGEPDENGIRCVRLLPTTWGRQVFNRAIGFDEQTDAVKLFRSHSPPGGFQSREDRDAARSSLDFRPEYLRDQFDVETAEGRCRVSTIIAMTARAREFVGLS